MTLSKLTVPAILNIVSSLSILFAMFHSIASCMAIHHQTDVRHPSIHTPIELLHLEGLETFRIIRKDAGLC